ncbi:MAG: J domain-containing protein [Candidatus Solibacter sp.]
MTDTDCRRVLNVPADASPQAIRQAYLDLARVWHPDRFQSDERLREIAGEHLREINDAFAVLKDRGSPGMPPRQEQANGGGRAAGGQASATATEEPVRTRPEPGRNPTWSSSWAPSPRFGYSRSISLLTNNAARAVLVAILLAVPYMAVSRLSSLLRIPSLTNNMISPLQPKILSPMRIIDPHSEVSVAAETLANWARGDGIDLWQPVQPRSASSQATAVRREDSGKAPAAAHRSSKRPVESSTHTAAPSNGTELIRAGRQSGAGELRVTNHTGLEAVFQLVSENRVRRAVYVAPNGSVTLRSIPIGVYYLHVELGRDLDAEHLRFLSDKATPSPLGPFQFLQITSETGTAGSQFDVVLNPQ